ncbi:MAG: oxidoreductase, partial [Gemmatimonadales bacterium]
MHNTNASVRPKATEAKSDSLATRLQTAVELLEEIVADRTVLADITEPERNRLLNAAGRVSRPDALDRRQLLKVVKRKKRAEKVQREEVLLAATGIRKLRRERVMITSPNIFPPLPPDEISAREQAVETEEERNCYVCKEDFSTVHHFYDRLCSPCAELNFAKRTELADLRGRVALLTGGRVKIGYQAGIKLLRSGARLIVTTRFPRDSAA